MFQYIQSGLGYSESQAYERLGAMRLMYKCPEVKKEIESGAMTLTAAAKVASHVKRLKLSNEQVTELLPMVAGQSTREIEKELLAREEKAGITPREQIKAVSANQTQVVVTLPNEVMQLLAEARDLDANPGASVVEVLEKALKVYIAK